MAPTEHSAGQTAEAESLPSVLLATALAYYLNFGDRRPGGVQWLHSHAHELG